MYLVYIYLSDLNCCIHQYHNTYINVLAITISLRLVRSTSLKMNNPVVVHFTDQNKKHLHT